MRNEPLRSPPYPSAVKEVWVVPEKVLKRCSAATTKAHDVRPLNEEGSFFLIVDFIRGEVDDGGIHLHLAKIWIQGQVERHISCKTDLCISPDSHRKVSLKFERIGATRVEGIDRRLLEKLSRGGCIRKELDARRRLDSLDALEIDPSGDAHPISPWIVHKV